MSRITVALASVIISSVTLAAAGWKVYTVGRDAGASVVQAKWDADKQAQRDAAVKESTRLQEKKNVAVKKSTVRKAAVAVDTRAADSELHRLHSTVKSQSIAPRLGDSCTTERQRIEALSDVFQQCTSELVEMARKADGHLEDTLMLLDAWPTLPGSQEQPSPAASESASSSPDTSHTTP